MKLRRRTFRIPYAALLIAGLLVLALGALRLALLRPTPPAMTPTAQASATGPRITERPGLETPQVPGGSSEALADEWARALLNGAEPLLLDPPQLPGALAWWQSSARQGQLDPLGGPISQGPELLDLSPYTRIDLLIPDYQRPDQFINLGLIQQEENLLRLSYSPLDVNAQSRQWLIGSPDIELPLRALASQGAERGYAVVVASTEGASPEALLLLLVDLRSTLPTPTITPGPSPTATATSTATLTPTPTRSPEIAMALVVNEALDPVIARMINEIDPGLTRSILDQHPFAGRLSWTPESVLINGRRLSVDRALNFSVFSIDEGGLLNTQKVLEIEFSFEATYFLEAQVFFQGHRIGEMLYWMVRRAEDSGGLLLVAYDDFGTRQSLIVVGFEALPPGVAPTPSPTP